MEDVGHHTVDMNVSTCIWLASHWPLAEVGALSVRRETRDVQPNSQNELA